MTVKTPVYPDYAATTPVNERITEKMIPYLTETFGNSASNSRIFDWEAERAVEKARVGIAALINADPEGTIFTSGATESDSLAIKGAADFCKTKDKRFITVKTEHKAVLDIMRELERQDFEVTYLNVQGNGLVDLDALKAAIREDIILVSVMWVNNEIGVVQDIPAIGEICRERKIVFHVDAAQVCDKVPVDVEVAKVDLLSISGHKIYDPEDIGVLYVHHEPRVRLETQIHGDDHERGSYSGTLPAHQIVGMGEAFRIAKEELEQDMAHYRKLRDIFLKGIEGIEEVYISGDLEHRAPDNLSVSFNFVEGENLIMAMKEFAVSDGSACISASLEPSHVLHAPGRSDELAHSSLRVTFGRTTTEEEIQFTAELVKSKIDKLRELPPLWGMFEGGIGLNPIEWAAH